MTAAYTYTYGEGPATELSITALNSGHAVATIPITTYFSSGESVDSTLYVNERWTAYGPISRSAFSDTQDIPGVYHLSYRFKGSQRSATVTGTLDLDEAWIQKVSAATLTVTH